MSPDDFCDDCAGTGIYYVPVGRKRRCRCCRGTGRYRPSRVCKACGGTGGAFANNECVCKGEGVHFYGESKPCAACRGTGTYSKIRKTECTTCEGRGKRVSDTFAIALREAGL